MESHFDDYVYKNYTVLPRHIKYLNEVNSRNHSEALRNSLDRLIEIDGRDKHIKSFSFFSNILLLISLGVFFLVFSTIINIWYISLVCMLMAGFLSLYSIILGVMYYKV